MSTGILVPIHVDGLALNFDKTVTGATADFSKLPYNNGKRDINVYPYISDSIMNEPFKNDTLHLKAGIHLHWMLPEALTKAIQHNKSSQFPCVPNRWLITQHYNGKVNNQWILESDFVYTETENEQPLGITVPTPPSLKVTQPFMYMGKKWPLDTWINTPIKNALYWPSLTAIGWGTPTFSSFYPNCASVFGFYDDSYTLSTIPNGTTYDIIGWYSDTINDPITTRIESLSKTTIDLTNDTIIAYLESELSWTVNTDQVLSTSTQTLCWGSITFNPKSKNETPLPTTNQLTLGNTGTEALSAYISQQLSSSEAPTIETQLESIMHESKVQGQTLDVGFAFEEAKHMHGFTATTGGIYYDIKSKPKIATKANAETASQQPSLPDSLLTSLTPLNEQLDTCHKLDQQIQTTRTQLFSDWHCYLQCLYPDNEMPFEYPDPNWVKYFITMIDIPMLEKLLDTATTEKKTLQTLQSSLESQLDTFNKSNNTAYTLTAIPTPRYWEANNPVLLITGEAATPSARCSTPHTCYAIPDISLGTITSDTFTNMHTQIYTLSTTLPSSCIGLNNWEASVWGPFILEWQSCLQPVSTKSNVNSDTMGYNSDFFSANYTLTNQAPIISENTNTIQYSDNPILYTNSTILTPHASTSMSKKITTYLTKTILGTYLTDNKITNPSDTYLSENIAAIKTWYASTFKPTSISKDPCYAAICALEVLQKTSVLSQSLGGFNQALLMQHQTFQLDVNDPFTFDPTFVSNVNTYTSGASKRSSLPYTQFTPIRAGQMTLNQCRLIDHFGQSVALDCTTMTTASSLSTSDQPNKATLPPRITQPARLNLRWQPATTQDNNPICGWILPNHLEKSLMIYDSQGNSIGSINQLNKWESPPGNQITTTASITNTHLQAIVTEILDQDGSYIQDFLSLIESAMENIHPETSTQHQSNALIMGKPLAIVRVKLDLELMGTPAINQTWSAFRQSLVTGTRPTDQFETVTFPIQLGAHQQLNDGLVGYWLEKNGAMTQPLYSPQATLTQLNTTLLTSYADDPQHLEQSINDEAQYITALFDPRGTLHATTGILPTKVISIPAHLYQSALEKIQITFLTAPLIMPTNETVIPIPKEDGYSWSWLSKLDTTVVTETDISPINPQAIFNGKPSHIIEGWLKLTPQQNTGGTHDKSK